MEELISVIVPVYKVEKYLPKCIESIINQTYKNLEIILVDDGSPDKCGEICEEYARKDTRIKVIHKENGGLSSARNIGIDKASGKYIAFVDSDDRIHERMYKVLYDNMKNTNADISICNLYYEFEINANEIRKINEDNFVKEYNKIDAIKELLYGKRIFDYAVNKLYRKEVFENIKYPEGKKMEDLGTTFLIFEKANKIVYDSTPLYYYLQRESSILGAGGEKLYLDFLELLIERYRYLKPKYLEMKDELDYNFVFYSLIISRKLSKEKMNVAESIINNEIEKNKNWKHLLTFKEKIKYMLFKNFNGIYKFIFK